MQPAPPPTATPAQPNYVLLEKGDPVRVMNPQNVVGDTTQDPLASRGYNSLIVDLAPGPGAVATTVTILGAPTPGGPWLQEVDGQAFQSGVATGKRFVVTGISAYSAVRLSNPLGWTVWFTPFNAASQTNVSITGTTTQNLAQYGGVAVGPANPLDVRPTGAIDVSDRAARQLGVLAGTTAVGVADGQDAVEGALADAANLTGAAGSINGKLRGLLQFFAAIASITFGWLRVQPQPSTFNLIGTSGANAAQTATQAAAGAGVRNYLTGLTVSWSGGAPAAGATIQVKDGATIIWETYLGRVAATQDNNDFEFTQPLQSSANASLSVTVAAAGAGVTTKIAGQGTTGP